MKSPLLYAVGAGILSGLSLISVTTMNPLFVLLSALASIPIIVSILAFGLSYGLLSGVIASLLVLVPSSTGPMNSLMSMIFAVAPYLILSYLAHQYRTITDENDQQSVEWYPTGRLVLGAAIIAAILTSLLILSIAGSYTAYEQQIGQMADNYIKAQKSLELNLEKTAAFKRYAITFGPPFFAIAIFFQILLNFWLAAKVTKHLGWLSRPWPIIREMEPPANFILVFLAVIAIGILTPGIPSVIASTFTATFTIAYFFFGLAVIHSITLKLDFRTLALTSIYLSVFLLQHIAIILIAILGIGEPIFKLKQRVLSSKSDDKSDNE